MMARNSLSCCYPYITVDVATSSRTSAAELLSNLEKLSKAIRPALDMGAKVKLSRYHLLLLSAEEIRGLGFNTESLFADLNVCIQTPADQAEAKYVMDQFRPSFLSFSPVQGVASLRWLAKVAHTMGTKLVCRPPTYNFEDADFDTIFDEVKASKLIDLTRFAHTHTACEHGIVPPAILQQFKQRVPGQITFVENISMHESPGNASINTIPPTTALSQGATHLVLGPNDTVSAKDPAQVVENLARQILAYQQMMVPA